MRREAHHWRAWNMVRKSITIGQRKRRVESRFNECAGLAKNTYVPIHLQHRRQGLRTIGQRISNRHFLNARFSK
jgi:hypothetical protein